MKYYLPVILLFIGLAGCTDRKNNEDADQETISTLLYEEANEVTVMPLVETDFNHEIISNGKLTARRYVDLKFESAEPIAEIYVRNGDRVVQGQKLAELAPFRLQNRSAQAKDALERARLELQDVLIGQGYMLADTANVPSGTMQLVRVRSGFDQAEAAYNLALYEESKAQLVAPFNGVVANLFARPYNIASTSDVFCTIIDPSSLEASFSVLESELALIKKGDRVEITPFSSTDSKATGQVTEINPLVDANGMVTVKASVSGNTNLFEGLNVRVSVQRSLGKQLVIPKGALVLRSGRQVVFTLVNGKAHWNYVETGLENASSYTLVSDNLKVGDIIITSGNINLAHDTPVTHD
jgi:RND family efflux transporter MFP subunit